MEKRIKRVFRSGDDYKIELKDQSQILVTKWFDKYGVVPEKGKGKILQFKAKNFPDAIEQAIEKLQLKKSGKGRW